jgi:hypothetical protein
MGRTDTPDLKPITSEPWLAKQEQGQQQQLQRERNDALLRVQGPARPKSI